MGSKALCGYARVSRGWRFSLSHWTPCHLGRTAALGLTPSHGRGNHQHHAELRHHQNIRPHARHGRPSRPMGRTKYAPMEAVARGWGELHIVQSMSWQRGRRVVRYACLVLGPDSSRRGSLGFIVRWPELRDREEGESRERDPVFLQEWFFGRRRRGLARGVEGLRGDQRGSGG